MTPSYAPDMKPDSKLFGDLEFRDLVKQVTSPDLGKKLSEQSMTLYCGFDPTSDSLHIGSLLPLMTLKRFQNAGHKVIAVVGGATGMIGDPSGKSQERSLLNQEQLTKNQAGITNVISNFLDLKGANPAVVVNNFDWFKNLSFVDFLRDIGKHFTVNHMTAKESVRARLEDREHGISYTEFSYMLLQAYDFYHLYKEKGCNLQIGGSDQWGNITAGTDLIRKIAAHGETPTEAHEVAFGLTHPLVNKADGTKFGKTEQGTVWLSANRTSPYQLYQFLIQTADADVIGYLKYFSFLSHAEIITLETSTKTEPEKRAAQNALAREVTKLVHGEAELQRAERATKALFGSEIKELDAKTLKELFAGAPSTEKPKAALAAPGISLVDLIAETGLCASKGAAKKDMTAGGIYVNNERITDPAATLNESDLIAGTSVVIRKGKKTYHLVTFV